MNNFTIRDLSGIDVYDYYYPHWVGCAGWIFRYKPLNQQFHLFSLSYADFEDILKILSYLNPQTKSEILNEYMQNMGDFEQSFLNKTGVMKDKFIFIKNLKLINKKHIEQLYIPHKESYLFPDDINYLYEIIHNLVYFFKLSENYEMEFLYI